MLQQQSAANPERRQRALDGLRLYQEAAREPRGREMPVLAARGGAMLRDYGGEGPTILFVPSLINPPDILDLSPSRSLLRWLASAGHRVLLLDWGWPDAQRRELSVSGHVETLLCPLMEELGEPVDLAGYCLGGTMAMAAASLAPVRRLVLIAAPWTFSGYGEAGASLNRLWQASHTSVGSIGLMPMELLQTAFWNLDPKRTIDKFVAFAGFAPGSEQARHFVQLEDWANDGPPVTAAAARELFEDMFAADLPGRGQWRVAGNIVDPRRLTVPALNIVSSSDRIVPASTAAPIGESLTLSSGHVGMIIGSRARQTLWAPLSDWLSRTAAKC